MPLPATRRRGIQLAVVLVLGAATAGLVTILVPGGKSTAPARAGGKGRVVARYGPGPSSSAAGAHGSRGRAAGPAEPAPSLRQLVGQRIMVGFHGTSPSSSLLRRIRQGKVGG